MLPAAPVGAAAEGGAVGHPGAMAPPAAADADRAMGRVVAGAGFYCYRFLPGYQQCHCRSPEEEPPPSQWTHTIDGVGYGTIFCLSQL